MAWCAIDINETLDNVNSARRYTNVKSREWLIPKSIKRKDFLKGNPIPLKKKPKHKIKKLRKKYIYIFETTQKKIKRFIYCIHMNSSKYE